MGYIEELSLLLVNIYEDTTIRMHHNLKEMILSSEVVCFPLASLDVRMILSVEEGFLQDKRTQSR